MTKFELGQHAKALGFGKRLPDAVYIIKPSAAQVTEEFWNVICRAERAAQPSPEWNLLKIHSDQCALTFLSYPEFDSTPHPTLTESTKINLSTGSVTHTDYRNRPNPPILHRKETFLPPSDPRILAWSELTKTEVEAGLYRDTSKIGLKLHWESLLKSLRLSYQGHTLVQAQGAYDEQPAQDIARHRTAIKRYDLSKPAKTLLEKGILRKRDTFFDYGCGHGMDVEALTSLGYSAAGWDPAFRANAPKIASDVVNLGYVLNVIEEPQERIQAIVGAFSLTKRVLLISTFPVGKESSAHQVPYRDGYITKTKTFQKFFAPGELEGLIQRAVGVEPITLGLGVCIVFRDEVEAEAFEGSRNRRILDWSNISAQLRFTTPSQITRSKVNRYELNKQLLDDLWAVMLDLGRMPLPGEFDRLSDVRKAAGGLSRAAAIVSNQFGPELLERSRRGRYR